MPSSFHITALAIPNTGLWFCECDRRSPGAAGMTASRKSYFLLLRRSFLVLFFSQLRVGRCGVRQFVHLMILPAGLSASLPPRRDTLIVIDSVAVPLPLLKGTGLYCTLLYQVKSSYQGMSKSSSRSALDASHTTRPINVKAWLTTAGANKALHDLVPMRAMLYHPAVPLTSISAPALGTARPSHHL